MGTFVYQAGFVGGDRRIGLVELFPEPSPDLVKIGQAGVVINRRIQQRQGLGKTVLANFILGQIVEIISSLGAVRRFDTYIAKEESRPPEERFTTPDLVEVTRLRDELKTNLAVRRSSRSRRKASYSARAVALKKLYECLRVAGSLIIIKHFDHTITTEMAKWGFEVVTKRPARKKDVEAAPETNGTETPSNTVIETTINGTADLSTDNGNHNFNDTTE